MAKKKTDPKKKKTATTKKKKSYGSRGQQLSDKLASRVSKGKLTYAQARKKQRAQDSVASRTTHVATKTRSSSQGLASKRTYKKAKFKIDKHGNKVAY